MSRISHFKMSQGTTPLLLADNDIAPYLAMGDPMSTGLDVADGADPSDDEMIQNMSSAALNFRASQQEENLLPGQRKLRDHISKITQQMYVYPHINRSIDWLICW